LRLQTHSTSAARASATLADELDPGDIEGGDQLHQRVDIASDHAAAGLHPLDGRNRKTGQASKLSLIDAQQGSGRAKLTGTDHAWSLAVDVQNLENYDPRIYLYDSSLISALLMRRTLRPAGPASDDAGLIEGVMAEGSSRA
jgi:hypothetical protein